MYTLLVGYKAGDLAVGKAVKGRTAIEEGMAVHVLDIYHRHAIEKVFHGAVKVVCSPHLPPAPSAAGFEVAGDDDRWDEIRFLTGPKLLSGELSLDLLQEIWRLKGKAKFTLDYVGRERDRNDLLDKVKDRADRSFRAEWPASVPGGAKLMFTSYPGCFCHRRLDEGGLALAEVVTREMKNEELETKNGGVKLLDMGCGCGLVGLLIADFFNRLQSGNGSRGARATETIEQSNNQTISNQTISNQTILPVLVDSHTRAVEAARENAEKFGIEAEVVLSDNGSPARMDGTFDVFVGNPPYYSDYRIAEVFLETAKRALRPGGVCYTVCKNAAGLEPVQRRYFPEVEIINRRGYAILKSPLPNP